MCTNLRAVQFCVFRATDRADQVTFQDFLHAFPDLGLWTLDFGPRADYGSTMSRLCDMQVRPSSPERRSHPDHSRVSGRQLPAHCPKSHPCATRRCATLTRTMSARSVSYAPNSLHSYKRASTLRVFQRPAQWQGSGLFRRILDLSSHSLPD